jgi:hypothetical protein
MATTTGLIRQILKRSTPKKWIKDKKMLLKLANRQLKNTRNAARKRAQEF